MDLKLRFTFYFSLFAFLLLGSFSTLVYLQVKADSLATAESILMGHLEHDIHHANHGHDHDNPATPPLHRRSIYMKVWKNGKLVEDTIPKELALLPGPPEQWIYRRMQATIEGDSYDVAGYYDLSGTFEYLSALRKVLALMSLLGMGLAIPSGFLLTKILLRPFRDLSVSAGKLDATHLSFRFPEPKVRDEYGRLVHTFNSLLHRLEKSFSQISRFASQASHELRTPIAVIATQAEMALRRPRENAEYQAALAKSLEQAKRLKAIVHHLLLMADLERAEHERPVEEIGLREAVDEVASSLKLAHTYPDKHIDLAGVPATVTIRSNRELTQMILSNLLENALKYAKARIEVRAERIDGQIRVRVEDDGPGIPEADREHVFEPFFKVDRAPEEKRRGHGLGLSIVKACVQACRGKISLDRSALGGTAVLVELPAPN